MTKHQNCVGIRFGKLTATEEIKNGKNYYYICQCECGNITRPIRADSLKSGKLCDDQFCNGKIKDLNGRELTKENIVSILEKNIIPVYWQGEDLV